MIEEFSATLGSAWGLVTRRKHRNGFARFLAWLDGAGIQATTDAVDFALAQLALEWTALVRRAGWDWQLRCH